MSNNNLRKLALAAMFVLPLALHAQSGPSTASTASPTTQVPNPQP